MKTWILVGILLFLICLSCSEYHSGFSVNEQITESSKDCDLNGVNLNGIDLTRTKLNGADLHYIKLNGANLTEAHLIGADLSFADLTNTDFTHADLSEADLTGAALTNTTFRSTRCTGAGTVSVPHTKLPDDYICDGVFIKKRIS